MTSWTTIIGAPTTEISDHLRWQVSIADISSGHLIDPDLIVGGGVGYVRDIGLYSDPDGLQRLYTRDIDAGSGSSADPQLTEAWENNALAITYDVPGSGITPLTVTGPNNSAVGARDSTEPYGWFYDSGSSHLSDIADFITAYRLLTDDQKAGTTYTLSDGLDDVVPSDPVTHRLRGEVTAAASAQGRIRAGSSPALPEGTITVGEPTLEEAGPPPRLRFLLSPGVSIGTEVVDGTGEAFFGNLQLYFDRTLPIGLRVSGAASGVSFGAGGPNLSDEWETDEAALILATTTTSVSIPGPRHSSNQTSDSGDEPYDWMPSADKITEIQNWMSAFGALPTTERSAVTLAFNVTPSVPVFHRLRGGAVAAASAQGRIRVTVPGLPPVPVAHRIRGFVSAAASAQGRIRRTARDAVTHRLRGGASAAASAQGRIRRSAPFEPVDHVTEHGMFAGFQPYIVEKEIAGDEEAMGMCYDGKERLHVLLVSGAVNVYYDYTKERTWHTTPGSAPYEIAYNRDADEIYVLCSDVEPGVQGVHRHFPGDPYDPKAPPAGKFLGMILLDAATPEAKGAVMHGDILHGNFGGSAPFETQVVSGDANVDKKHTSIDQAVPAGGSLTAWPSGSASRPAVGNYCAVMRRNGTLALYLIDRDGRYLSEIRNNEGTWAYYDIEASDNVLGRNYTVSGLVRQDARGPKYLLVVITWPIPPDDGKSLAGQIVQIGDRQEVFRVVQAEGYEFILERYVFGTYDSGTRARARGERSSTGDPQLGWGHGQPIKLVTSIKPKSDLFDYGPYTEWW